MIRRELQLSQIQLAEKLSVKRHYIADLETDRKKASEVFFKKFDSFYPNLMQSKLHQQKKYYFEKVKVHFDQYYDFYKSMPSFFQLKPHCINIPRWGRFGKINYNQIFEAYKKNVNIFSNIN